jgi:hypothetical protein
MVGLARRLVIGVFVGRRPGEAAALVWVGMGVGEPLLLKTLHRAATSIKSDENTARPANLLMCNSSLFVGRL